MSGYIPRTFINELISRCDIVELIHEHVALRKTGRNYVACCPFHNEKTPSFNVSPSKQIYHCFGCGAGGNAISFLMEYERLEFVDAIESLASRFGLTVPREANHLHQNPVPTNESEPLYAVLEVIAKDYQHQLLTQTQAQNALNYLKNRGINSSVIKQFNIGFASSGWNNLQKLIQSHTMTQEQLITTGMLIKKDNSNIYDRFRERIMFPIRDRRGRVVGFGGRTLTDETPKYLNSPETPIFHKSNELYGLYEARQANRELENIIIVEGYMDVIALAQYEITNAVATLGTAATSEHLRRLFRYTSEIIFCFDGDQAGKKAAWRALENSLPLLKDGKQARFMFLPEGEDPDSLIRQHGKQAFNDYMHNAVPLSDFIFQEISLQADLSNLGGKAKFANLIKPLINKLPDNIFRHMLLEKLAALLRIDNEKLIQLLSEPNVTTTPASQITSKTKPQHINKPSPIRMALTLLIQNPELVKHISGNEPFYQLNNPGILLFMELIELLQHSLHVSNSYLNTGNILEYWRNKAQEQTIRALAQMEHCIPESGIDNEFLEILKRLNLLSNEQQMDQLLQKANLHGLTNSERTLLQNLIAKKHVK